MFLKQCTKFKNEYIKQVKKLTVYYAFIFYSHRKYEITENKTFKPSLKIHISEIIPHIHTEEQILTFNIYSKRSGNW